MKCFILKIKFTGALNVGLKWCVKYFVLLYSIAKCFSNIVTLLRKYKKHCWARQDVFTLNYGNLSFMLIHIIILLQYFL